MGRFLWGVVIGSASFGLCHGESATWSVPLDSDPDFPAYLRFLDEHRSPSQRRRLRSHSAERFRLFKASLQEIRDRDAHDSATYGVNMFSDLSDEEFLNAWTSGQQHWNESHVFRSGWQSVEHESLNVTRRRELLGGETVVDWRFKDGGKVTRVKNQQGSAINFGPTLLLILDLPFNFEPTLLLILDLLSTEAHPVTAWQVAAHAGRSQRSNRWRVTMQS